MPIAQNASESTVATKVISSSWPRTNAPSLASISSQVSRTVLRCLRAIIDVTRPIALSRSKIQ